MLKKISVDNVSNISKLVSGKRKDWCIFIAHFIFVGVMGFHFLQILLGQNRYFRQTGRDDSITFVGFYHFLSLI